MHAVTPTDPGNIQELDGLTEEQLYHLLGIRLEEAARSVSPASGGGFPESYGPPAALITLGKDFFNRVERQAFELMCGKGRTYSDPRDRIATAFPFGASDVAAAIATAFASHLAMTPGVATVVAALVMKLFFNPALASTCDAWQTRLAPHEPNSARSPDSPTAS